MCNTFEMKPCLERVDKRHFVIIVCLFNQASVLIITLELSSQLPFLYQTKYVVVNEYEMETLFRVRPSDTLPSHDASDVPNMPNQRSKKITIFLTSVFPRTQFWRHHLLVCGSSRQSCVSSWAELWMFSYRKGISLFIGLATLREQN